MKITLGDKILIAALFVLNVGLLAVWGAGYDQGSWVVIEVDQKEVARLPLSQDRHTHVEGPLGTTEVEIKNGKARIVRSPCKNKVCIKSGYIQYADRLSVCIPNKVVVRILGENSRGVDTIVG
ncbi:MAG: NusG domain II-containing protein [Nitrospinaceae bacterium]